MIFRSAVNHRFIQAADTLLVSAIILSDTSILHRMSRQSRCGLSTGRGPFIIEDWIVNWSWEWTSSRLIRAYKCIHTNKTLRNNSAVFVFSCNLFKRSLLRVGFCEALPFFGFLLSCSNYLSSLKGLDWNFFFHLARKIPRVRRLL